jgi:hypothetical protein
VVLTAIRWDRGGSSLRWTRTKYMARYMKLTFLSTDRAAWTNSGPYAELFTACFICSDSPLDLYSEEIKSTEPIDASDSPFSLFLACSADV